MITNVTIERFENFLNGEIAEFSRVNDTILSVYGGVKSDSKTWWLRNWWCVWWL